VQRHHESGEIVIVTACPKGVISATVRDQLFPTVTFLPFPNSVKVCQGALTVIQRAMHIHPTVSEFIPTLMDQLKPLQ